MCNLFYVNFELTHFKHNYIDFEVLLFYNFIERSGFMTLGEKIYNIRKSSNLSQEEFGNIFNVSRQSVSKWETNQVQPELKTIIEISKFFNVSLDSMLLDETDVKKNSSSLQDVYKLKLKFILGCFVLLIGVILLCVSMYISKDVIAYYGSLFKYFYVCLIDGSFFDVFYYIMIFGVMIFGCYIISTVFKERLHK